MYVCMYTPINLCISACVYKLCVYFYECMHLLICAKACMDVYAVRHKDFSVLTMGEENTDI